jgi:hypothetical protein
MTYAEVLNYVFESGRITTSSDKRRAFNAEVEAEIHFEASERFEAGELEGTIDECVAFALERIA